MKKIYYLSTVFLTLLLLGTTVSTTAQTDLVQPNSTGIVWVTETTHNIVWGGEASTHYDIYYKKGETTPVLIAADKSGNTYSWDIPDITLGNDYKIELYAEGGGAEPPVGTAVFESLNNFELTDTPPEGTGEIHVNQPNVTGIQWAPDTDHGIYWDDDLVEPVKLELWEDVGGGGEQIYSGVGTTDLPTSVEGTGYIWTIPAGITEGTYWIKVMSTTTDVFDFGDNPFSITDEFSGGTYVEMIQPDVEGLQWESGTTHLISWMDDLIENVDLVLYVGNGATPEVFTEYSGSPASALPTDNVGTTVDWDIPETLPNGNYKIYAESSVTSSINDISEYPFEVTDTPSGGTTITLIQPEEAGIQWLFDGTYVISWMDDLIEPVDIELYKGGTDPGDLLLTLAEDVVGTTWDWEIPASGGAIADADDYKIKIVSSATPPTTSDISTNSFEITATPSGGTEIEVIQPSVDGLEWEEGTEHLISWMDDLIEPVNIKLVNYSTGSAVDVAFGVSGIPTDDFTGTTWTWDIPETGLVGAGLGPFKIVITSSASSITDDSEYTFDIIDYSPYGEVIMIQPNGGEEWIKGNSYLISWTDNISENVDIFVTDDYTDLGSHPWELLSPGGGVPSSTWTWNTNTATGGVWPTGLAVTGDKFKIKISSINTSSSAIDTSEDPFDFVQTIGGEVWVIQPDGGEVWVDETEYLISWMDELVENVYIKLYNYSNPNSPVLIDWEDADLPDNTDGIGIEGTTWTWDIPETGTDPGDLQAGTHYRIRIESIYDDQYNDISEANFSIVAEQTGGTTIEVIQPNGGEEWALNTEHLISWDDDVFEDVVIALYDNSQPDPVFIKEIEDNVEGTTYEWDIDDGEYGVGTYLIRIYSTEDSDLEDYSDAYFTLTGTKEGESNINFAYINGDLVMYPNPTSTQFTIAASGSISRVEVRNLLGQVLYNSNVDATQTVIDVSGYDAGIYIVNIIVEGEVVTKKLFVQ